MFIETARQWIQELLQAGKLKERSPDELERLAADIGNRLEDFFNQAVSRHLGGCGKVGDYERMLLYDGQYVHKYLNQAIPGYPAFRAEIFEQAKKQLLADLE